MDRELPNEPEAERAVLGGIILENVLMSQAMAHLEPNDFYNKLNQKIYIRMCELSECSVDIDAITICQNGIGSQVRYVADLTYGLPRALNLVNYIKILKDKSATRRFIRLSAEIEARAMDGDDVVSLAAHIDAVTSDIRKGAGIAGGAFRSFSEVAKEASATYEALHRGVSHCAPTGFASLDRATRGGIHPGDVWVVMALTGNGKSSWLLNAARHQGEKGIPSAIVSREMSDFENFARIHSSISGVAAWKIQPGIWPEDFHRLNDTCHVLSNLPIWINSRTGSVYELKQQVKDLVKNHAIRVLYVDYLQLMSASSGKTSTRAGEVEAISRTLKEIAMEHQIGVVSLSQPSREGARAPKVKASHNRESSAIEDDASVVLVIDMPEDREGLSEWECTMRIDKHRMGPKLSLSYRYNGQTLTFSES